MNAIPVAAHRPAPAPCGQTVSDLRGIALAQVLCTRLCHDLAGPAGALKASAELLADPRDTDPAGTAALVGHAAAVLAARLAFYRVAFGLGREGDQALPPGEAADLAAALFAGERVKLRWHVNPCPPAPEAGEGRAAPPLRAVLNLLLVAAACLPRGGTVTIAGAIAGGRAGSGEGPVQVHAEGMPCRLPAAFAALFFGDGGLPELTTQSAPAVLALHLAAESGHCIAVDESGDGSLRFHFRRA